MGCGNKYCGGKSDDRILLRNILAITELVPVNARQYSQMLCDFLRFIFLIPYSWHTNLGAPGRYWTFIASGDSLGANITPKGNHVYM